MTAYWPLSAAKISVVYGIRADLGHLLLEIRVLLNEPVLADMFGSACGCSPKPKDGVV